MNLFDLTRKGGAAHGRLQGHGAGDGQGACRARGATVVVSARKQEALDEAAAATNALGGGKAHAVSCNAGDKAQLRAGGQDA